MQLLRYGDLGGSLRDILLHVQYFAGRGFSFKYVVHGGWLDFLVTSLLKVHCDNIVQKLKSG